MKKFIFGAAAAMALALASTGHAQDLAGSRLHDRQLHDQGSGRL